MCISVVPKGNVCHLSNNEPSSIKSGKARDKEETIRQVLSTYEIGAKLRQLRLKKKIALVDLGKRTGLSASMLSQLENSRLIPTLPTLVRIAMVFDVGIEYFFGDRKQPKPFLVLRREERFRFPDDPDSSTPNYFFECLASSTQTPVQIYAAEILRVPEESVHEHTHEGTEFFHLLEGSIAMRCGEEDCLLRAGDSVYFDSSTPHSYRGTSRTPARAIVVTTNPRI